MADSGALRQRRSKAHKQGDHRYCRGSCATATQLRAVAAAADADAVDTDQGLASLARTLQAAYEADPGNALLARELRMTLQALRPVAGKPVDGDLAGLFAELGAS